MSTIGGVSGLATVVFVDVEGSTSLIDRVGDDAGTDAVGRQLDRVRERIETYGGREVKSLGDGNTGWGVGRNEMTTPNDGGRPGRTIRHDTKSSVTGSTS